MTSCILQLPTKKCLLFNIGGGGILSWFIKNNLFETLSHQHTYDLNDIVMCLGRRQLFIICSFRFLSSQMFFKKNDNFLERPISDMFMKVKKSDKIIEFVRFKLITVPRGTKDLLMLKNMHTTTFINCNSTTKFITKVLVNKSFIRRNKVNLPLPARRQY